MKLLFASERPLLIVVALLNNVVLPVHWEQFDPHLEQSRLWRSKARFKAVYAGRGSGKTAVAKKYIVRWLPVKKPWGDVKYFYGMPTYRQAKRVAWYDIVKLVPKDWLSEPPNLSDMCIRTKFGSELYVMGLDRPERIEGVQWDGGVIDESSDQKPGIFERNILPALMHKDAWCWRIGVPKRYGIGANDFRDFCEKGMRHEAIGGTEDTIETYTWRSDSVLPPERLEWYKTILDERDYEEQLNANWQSVGGAIFYAFDERIHVRSDIGYNPELSILVASDFNVNPMSWVLAQVVDGKVFCFDEIFLRNINTPETLNVLWKRYSEHKAGFEFYGDATSRQRRSSAAFTDYAHIARDDRYDKHVKKKVYYLRANPPLIDRFSACNSIFKNAAGEIRCYISSKCIQLVRDLRTRAYKEETRDPNDTGDIGHMSDAFGYLISRRFPIRIKLFDQKARVNISNMVSAR